MCVAVIGCGGVGLSAIQGARIAGAEKIIAIDVDPAKLDLARELGASHAVDGRGDVVAQVRAIEGLGVHVAIEAIGKYGDHRDRLGDAPPGRPGRRDRDARRARAGASARRRLLPGEADLGVRLRKRPRAPRHSPPDGARPQR